MSKQCYACYAPCYLWLKLEDYPGMYLCMEHNDMMYEDPAAVMSLAADKQEKIDKRGRMKKEEKKKKRGRT